MRLRDPVGPDLALIRSPDVLGEQPRSSRSRLDSDSWPSAAELLADSGFMPVSAMNARITSFAPSKIGKMRVSRSIFSYGSVRM